MFGGTRGIVEARYAGLELKEKAYQDALRHLDEGTRHLGEASTLLRTSIQDKRTRDDRRQDKRAVAPSPFPLMYPPVVFGLDDDLDDDLDEDEDFGATVDDRDVERILRNLDEASSLLRATGTADKRLRDRRQIDQRASTFGPMTFPVFGSDDLAENRQILRASNRFDRAVERGASRVTRAAQRVVQLQDQAGVGYVFDEELDDHLPDDEDDDDDLGGRALRARGRFERGMERGAGRAARRLDRFQDRSGMTDDEIDQYLDDLDEDLDEEFGSAFTDQIAEIENQVVGIVKKYVSMLKVPSLLSFNKQRDAVIDSGKSSDSPEAVALEKKGLGLLSGITQPAAAQLWTLARKRDNLRRQSAGRAPEPVGTPPKLV